jgi:hypothetical protein
MDLEWPADSMQLRPWLDPLGDGRLTLEGAFNDRIVLSDFRLTQQR